MYVRHPARGGATDEVTARVSAERDQGIYDYDIGNLGGSGTANFLDAGFFTELEPLMEPHKEDPAYKQAEKDLRKGPVTQAGVFFAWLTDGMEPQVESSLKSYVPAPVVLLESELGDLVAELGLGEHRQAVFGIGDRQVLRRFPLRAGRP